MIIIIIIIIIIITEHAAFKQILGLVKKDIYFLIMFQSFNLCKGEIKPRMWTFPLMNSNARRKNNLT